MARLPNAAIPSSSNRTSHRRCSMCGTTKGRWLGLRLAFVVIAAVALIAATAAGEPYRMVAKDRDYVGDEHIGHRLDVYLPETGDGPFPVVVFIYGSAWTSSDKKGQGAGVAEFLCPEGFATVAINHRGTVTVDDDGNPVPSGDVFPAQIHDIKAAIRYLRAMASIYCLDPQRIGVLGGSSGGHLAALLGTSGGVEERTVGSVKMDIEGDLGVFDEHSSRVQAVLSIAGTSNLLTLSSCDECPSCPNYDGEDSVASLLIGGAIQSHSDACTLASPLTYIDAGDPPFALFHGDQDHSVPWCQSRDLHNALRAACVPSSFTLVEGYGHTNLTQWPGFTEAIIGFFQRTLAPMPTPDSIRFASFNVKMFRDNPGALVDDLTLTDGDAQAYAIAEIVQHVQPDVLLINELDYDIAGQAAEIFRTEYLGTSQGGLPAIDYPYVFTAPGNNGVPTEFDLNRNNKFGEPEDALGYGTFEGQYGMVLYSRYPILLEGVRTFREFLWRDMPGAALPTVPGTGEPWYDDEVLDILPLSSNSHWDVPIRFGDQVIHVLATHATPPTYDGDEKRNARRNHDQIRFWADYIAPGPERYITDDAGGECTLPTGAHFVVMGDLNADPKDGDSYDDAIWELLNLLVVNKEMTPWSDGGVVWSTVQGGINGLHTGHPRYDTGDFPDWKPGNLRVDYVLPSTTLEFDAAKVFWPAPNDPLAPLVQHSDHRLVWVEVSFVGETVPDPKLELTLESSSVVKKADDIVEWTLTIVNTGPTVIHDLTVSDPTTGEKMILGSTCSMIHPGETRRISWLDQEATQVDMDNGYLSTSAVASGTDALGRPVEAETTGDLEIEQIVKLEFTKKPNKTQVIYPGSIKYTFEVTNRGNVTLKGIHVDDESLNVSLDLAHPAGLIPGDSASASVIHQVTWDESWSPCITNVATAKGFGPQQGQIATATDDASVKVTGKSPIFGGIDMESIFELLEDDDPFSDFEPPLLVRIPWPWEIITRFDLDLEALINVLLHWFGHVMIGTGVDGSILTIGGSPCAETTLWFKQEQWSDVHACRRGDPVDIRFALGDILTGQTVRDDTANLTVVRVEPDGGQMVSDWLPISFDPNDQAYAVRWETTSLEPGLYSLYIGTSRDGVSRQIQIEVTGP